IPCFFGVASGLLSVWAGASALASTTLLSATGFFGAASLDLSTDIVFLMGIFGRPTAWREFDPWVRRSPHFAWFRSEAATFLAHRGRCHRRGLFSSGHPAPPACEKAGAALPH